MLLKGVGEVETAPDRRAAAEMVLIRLCHVAEHAAAGRPDPPADDTQRSRRRARHRPHQWRRRARGGGAGRRQSPAP